MLPAGSLLLKTTDASIHHRDIITGAGQWRYKLRLRRRPSRQSPTPDPTTLAFPTAPIT